MAGRHLAFTLSALAVLATLSVSAQNQGRTGQQPPTRDTPGQLTQQAAQPGKGRISGRVFAADTGRPVKRARVLIAAPEMQRGALTDDSGVFDFAELPAGRYTLTVSKTGFINLSYGQRRPLMAGTPLQLADGQQLTGIDFQLPRGSVIAGHIFDESGDPLPGANVQVMRYQYAQGSRQLVPAGGGQTDDQGAYRVWGLNPGDYYVSAVTRNLDFGGRGGPPGPLGPGVLPPLPPGAAGAPAGRGGRGAAAAAAAGAGEAIQQALAARAMAAGPPVSEPVSYAPTFYPGVPSVNDARAITLGLGAETLNIDFGLQLVRTARVSGHVTNPDGSPTTAGNVNLTPDTGQMARGGPGRTFGSRVQWDGSFSMANVPPGRYIVRARGEDTAQPQFAAVPLTISDGDATDLTVVLAPGASLSGTITFQATQSQTVPDVNQVRVAAPPVDFINVGPNPVARVDREGKFTIDGVSAGEHWIRTQGAVRGWTLKSVLMNGREIIDTPLDVRSGQKLTGLSLVFTDKLSEVSGTVTDERGTPVTDYTVLAFPTDASLWRAQARQIMTARPDQNGKYQIRGLPAGDYYLAMVDPTEQGEWFEAAFLDQHRVGALRVLLGDGDVKTQDFKIASR